jgi:phage host-nuclease inhibitor protein Gam
MGDLTMTRRIKAPALPVPASREEADRLLGDLGALQRELDHIDADLTATCAAAKLAASKAAAPIADEIRRRFSALGIWAEEHRSRLLEGDRKSVALGQGVIGWRWGMPTVRIARGQEEAVIEELARRALGHLIRTRQEVDREAVLRAPELVADLTGIVVEQIETFFAKPLDLESEQVRTVRRAKVARVA